MKPIAQRMHRIKESPTLTITAKASELKAAGKDVVGFGVGEPDFNTPDNIMVAAHKAMLAGKTKYTPIGGTTELKDAVIAKLKRENDLDYKREQIIITTGGKHALFQIFMALVDAGDEVIVPAPYWVSYPDQIQLFGGKPVYIETSDKTHFKITPEQLRAVITPATIALVINSPSNPTGAAYTAEELSGLARVCKEKNIYIISDEIYEHIIYDGFKHVSVAALAPEFKDITVVTNGASKCYAMTGWRMGFAAGPAHIITAMTKAQGQSVSNVCSITQAACVEAYNGPQQAIGEMRVAFKTRRDYMVQALNAIEGLSCNTPEGAFYVFPNVSRLFGKKTPAGRVISSVDDFSLFLLEEHLVAVVPGTAFGAEGYIRLSYATDMETIKKGMERMGKAVGSLR